MSTEENNEENKDYNEWSDEEKKAGMQRWINYNSKRMDAYYKGKLKSVLSEFDFVFESFLGFVGLFSFENCKSFPVIFVISCSY